jgi:hypothetical protein
MNRIVGRALGLVVAVASVVPAQQQRVRWNDVAAALDDLSDPPAVRVWLDQRILRYGEPVRVAFRVEEDAFVVVARVDWDGNLTVLHPRGRTRATAVKGGEDVYIRSARMGTRATFVATERSGGTGYVFALASRAPLDLSRLSQRDFSSWVTGNAIGRPTSRYVGDPYRVIQRFARLVLYNPDSEWDYDVEFYSVDQPGWVTASSYYCAPWNSYGRRALDPWGYGRLDEFGDGFVYGYGSGCASAYDYYACYTPLYGYGFALPFFCGPRRQGRIATGPTTPAPPLTEDSLRVNPWVPDSVGRPNVDKGSGSVNGPHVMTVDPTRPAPVGQAWRDDLSFSIPARALRGIRERRSEIGRSPASEPSGSGPMPMPSRPTPEVSNPGQTIEWVRPPRSLDQPPTRDMDRMPVRGGIRRDMSSTRAPDRGGVREWSPPPRTSSPMFEREPSRGGGMPAGRAFDAGTRGPYNPPAHLGSRPVTSPAIRHSTPAAGTGASAPSPPPARSDPPAAREPPASGERKPPGEKH